MFWPRHREVDQAGRDLPTAELLLSDPATRPPPRRSAPPIRLPARRTRAPPARPGRRPPARPPAAGTPAARPPRPRPPTRRPCARAPSPGRRLAVAGPPPGRPTARRHRRVACRVPHRCRCLGIWWRRRAARSRGPRIGPPRCARCGRCRAPRRAAASARRQPRPAPHTYT